MFVQDQIHLGLIFHQHSEDRDNIWIYYPACLLMQQRRSAESGTGEQRFKGGVLCSVCLCREGARGAAGRSGLVRRTLTSVVLVWVFTFAQRWM